MIKDKKAPEGQTQEPLTEKELHCVARLLQGAIYGEEHNVFDGCAFCMYQCHNEIELAPNFELVMQKIMNKTGVDLSPAKHRLIHSGFPYKKFLKNANEDAKEYFRNYFKNI